MKTIDPGYHSRSLMPSKELSECSVNILLSECIREQFWGERAVTRLQEVFFCSLAYFV